MLVLAVFDEVARLSALLLLLPLLSLSPLSVLPTLMVTLIVCGLAAEMPSFKSVTLNVQGGFDVMSLTSAGNGQFTELIQTLLISIYGNPFCILTTRHTYVRRRHCQFASARHLIFTGLGNWQGDDMHCLQVDEQHSWHYHCRPVPLIRLLDQPTYAYYALTDIATTLRNRIDNERAPVTSTVRVEVSVHQLHSQMQYLPYYTEPESASSCYPEPGCQLSPTLAK